MRLSGVVMTLNGEQRLERVLASFKPLCDEMVVCIDDTTQDRSAELAQDMGAKVLFLPHQGYIEPSLPAMYAACSGDWILRLDDDESLAGPWKHSLLEQAFVARPKVTHCYVLRRWLIPGGRCLTSEPWQADYQLRLMRNDPSLIDFPKHIHARIDVQGERYVWGDLFIDHWDLLENSLAQREAKVARYTALGVGLANYYLYEKIAHSSTPLKNS